MTLAVASLCMAFWVTELALHYSSPRTIMRLQPKATKFFLRIIQRWLSLFFMFTEMPLIKLTCAQRRNTKMNSLLFVSWTPKESHITQRNGSTRKIHIWLQSAVLWQLNNDCLIDGVVACWFYTLPMFDRIKQATIQTSQNIKYICFFSLWANSFKESNYLDSFIS